MSQFEKRQSLKDEMQAATSTPPDFRWVEGRRHLVNAPYMLPKDSQETQRLDLQHQLLFSRLGSNLVAPIENPTAILDVGCGTGRWCQEMATTFPQAQVIGVDVVLPERPSGQGEEFWPSNCTFLQGNVLQELPFADGSFDIVHQRLLMGALPAEKWQGVVNELARVTRPGGWIELIESEAMFPRSGPSTQQISQWIIKAGQRRGIDVLIGRGLKRFLQGAKVECITTEVVHIPMNKQGEPVERMSADVVLVLFQSLRPLIVASLDVSGEEFDRLLALAAAEWEQYGTANPFYVTYGQRPAI